MKVNNIESLNESRIKTHLNGVYELSVDKYYNNFPDLPLGYGLIGSGARQLLELNLGLIEAGEQLRDYDIVRTIPDEPYNGSDDELARKYMFDDFQHDHGVKVMSDDYFSTRDFTINEVYYSDGKIFFSQACYNDLLSQTIRLTTDTFNEEYGNHDFRNTIKALRLYIERKDQFPQSKIEFINPDQLGDSYCNLFWIALNLDKAHFSGVSDKFLHLLQEIGYLPDHLKTPQEAKRYIEESGEVFGFNFKFIGADFYYEAEFTKLLDDYEYQEYVLGDKVMEILDELHPYESSRFKGWKKR